MSNDLISRSAVLDILFHNGEWECDANKVYERISSLPTEYDLNNVCMQLKSMDPQDMMSEEQKNVLNYAIEIVESGGVKE